MAFDYAILFLSYSGEFKNDEEILFDKTQNAFSEAIADKLASLKLHIKMATNGTPADKSSSAELLQQQYWRYQDADIPLRSTSRTWTESQV